MSVRAALAAICVAGATLAAVACGEDASRFGAGTDLDASAGDGSLGFPDGAIPVGDASGIVILHAAAFPAFRLCFSNYPELPPQPDRTVMPQANVVGVEVGSVVRTAPLDRAPGKVFVIAQRKVLATRDETAAKSCGELLADDTTVIKDIDYHEAGELTSPLGVGRVSVLAITGCGSLPYIEAFGVPQEECGPDYDTTRGSLRARTLTLLPSIAATETALPVQIVHLSTALEARRAPGETIEVTFGPLDGGPGSLGQPVAAAPPLFDASAPVTLMLDQTSESTYGTHGFRIALRGDPDAGDDAGGAAATVVVDQSLAEVQDLSSPQTVPTTYYRAASNYVLLLIGDPRVTRALDDGGPNPDYNPRRGVHVLAVPVKDDETDAGSAQPTTDGGSVSTGDGG